MSFLSQTITYLSTRVQLRYKIILLISLSLSFYTIITSETISLLVGFDNRFSKSGRNPSLNNQFRRHGFRTIDSNGHLLYYHLPNLTEYRIADHYKDIGENGHHLCHKLGTDWNATTTSLDRADAKPDGIRCVCGVGYSGPDCGVPSTVYSSLNQINNLKLKIERLWKPKRLVLSVILYLPDDQSVGTSIKYLNSTLNSISDVIDLFVITRINIIDSNRTQSPNQELNCGPNVMTSFNVSANDCRRESQNKSLDFLELITSQENRYSDIVLYQNVNLTAEQLQRVGVDGLHLFIMSRVWNTSVQSVTDFRPNDFIIFMFCNTFPLKPILVFLKHYSGYPEPIKLLSYSKKWSKQTNKLNIVSKMLNNPIIANNNRLVNIAVTFEYLVLCRYDFQLFKNNLCVNNESNVSKFNRTYWPIKYWSIGDRNRRNQSANSLLTFV